MEARRRAFNDTRIKTETTWRQEGSGFSQLCQQALLQAGKFLASDQSKCITGGVKHLDSVREAEAIRIQAALAGGVVHPPAPQIMGQEQSVEFLPHYNGLVTAHGLVAQTPMVFWFIDPGFDLPALMRTENEFESRR